MFMWQDGHQVTTVSRPACVELLHRARGHAGGDARVRLLRRTAAVAGSAGRRRGHADGFEYVRDETHDLAMARHVAAVPEGDAGIRGHSHLARSSSFMVSRAKALTRADHLGSCLLP